LNIHQIRSGEANIYPLFFEKVAEAAALNFANLAFEGAVDLSTPLSNSAKISFQIYQVFSSEYSFCK